MLLAGTLILILMQGTCFFTYAIEILAGASWIQEDPKFTQQWI